jgi:hypothetical protein
LGIAGLDRSACPSLPRLFLPFLTVCKNKEKTKIRKDFKRTKKEEREKMNDTHTAWREVEVCVAQQ